mmetsp:Transcript_5304/g.9077  ORF Transcript_5304/g.9077 Transcript_5304/m.9077 type:complete len:202 (+) Transcript_5304:42-647(+)
MMFIEGWLVMIVLLPYLPHLSQLLQQRQVLQQRRLPPPRLLLPLHQQQVQHSSPQICQRNFPLDHRQIAPPCRQPKLPRRHQVPHSSLQRHQAISKACSSTRAQRTARHSSLQNFLLDRRQIRQVDHRQTSRRLHQPNSPRRHRAISRASLSSRAQAKRQHNRVLQIQPQLVLPVYQTTIRTTMSTAMLNTMTVCTILDGT